jgi:hypothetical protein
MLYNHSLWIFIALCLCKCFLCIWKVFIFLSGGQTESQVLNDESALCYKMTACRRMRSGVLTNLILTDSNEIVMKHVRKKYLKYKRK